MEDNKKQYSIKVVMLGDTEVGKTSIIQRFVKNDFKSYFQSTQGVHFEEKKIILENGVHIDYKVWDTAGQERFKSINSLYYKDARIAVLVYDITNEQSFETLKFWYSHKLKEVKEHGKKNCILAIVGNKSDLDNDTVNASEAQHLARENDALFRLTSAKVGNGIEDLFQDLGYKFLEQRTEKKKQQNTTINQNQSQQNVVLDQSKQKKQSKKKGCC